jgi:hypothetical protein
LSSRILLPAFLCTCSGLAFAKQLRQMNIGLFFTVKRQLYSSALLCACHRTRGLHCMLPHELLAMLIFITPIPPHSTCC